MTEPDRYFSALAQAVAELTAHASTASEQAVPYIAPQSHSSVDVMNTAAPGPHGDVPVRVYRSSRMPTDAPVLVWCHGGGFVGGDLDMPEADTTGKAICAATPAIVVSVDYRLAINGVHFPVPHDDLIAAYEWALSMTESWGSSTPSVSLGGASAGGCLALGAALRLRDEGRSPDGLLLMYPALHPDLAALASDPDAPAPDPMIRLYPLGIENFAGSALADAHPYAVPGMGDLTRLPRTLVVNCERDPMRPLGEEFTRRASAAGVDVRELLVHEVGHGHINSPWLPQAQQTYLDMATWLSRSSLS